MKKKGISLATLIAFLAFSWSCVSYKVSQEVWRDLSAERQQKAKIVKVKMNSGAVIEFSGGPPARMTKAGIVGTQRIKNFHVEKSRVRNIKRLDDQSRGKKGVLELHTIDGKSYTILSYKERGGVLICDALISYVIPSGDVDLAWIKRVNTAMTGFLNVLWLVPVAGAIVLMIAISNISIAAGWS